MLANIRKKLMRLVEYLKQTHPNKQQTQLLKSNFRNYADTMSENTPDSRHTSYSLNKGEKVYFCMRQRNEQEQLVEENIMTFVALHELAHICTAEIGHTPLFWNNFAFLLKEAEKMGIYQYQDFAKQPVQYCGVYITDAPVYKE
jgi:predicted metal-dependent hydrolase